MCVCVHRHMVYHGRKRNIYWGGGGSSMAVPKL